MKAIVNEMTEAGLHINFIRTLFDMAEVQGILLWLESGWAIDARLARITRDHSDIDIAFPNEHRESFIRLLEDIGFTHYEELVYGFLMSKDGVLIDAEPCFLENEVYALPGFPPNSCPFDKEGVLDGFPVRCLSWEAMYAEFIDYKEEVPAEKWRTKDWVSLGLIEEHLTLEQIKFVQSGINKKQQNYRQ